MNEGAALLELAQNTQSLFERQNAREKRRVLNFVLSNCIWDYGEVVVTFRQPCDLSAEKRHGIPPERQRQRNFREE